MRDANGRAHTSAGVRTGGQYATEARAEADVSLGAPTGVDDNVFTHRYDSVEEKVAAFHAELEQRVADLQHDENWLAYLDTMSKFHHYSMLNQLLIAAQRPDASRVAGFRKWQELGRQVRKGEKGMSIFAPKTRRVPVLDKAGNPVKGEDGKTRYDVRCVGFTTTTVFDLEQTDGEDLPEANVLLTGDAPDGYTEDLEAAITARGFSVTYEQIPGQARGFTEPGTKRVVVDADLSHAMRAKVLAHELGHIACGHLDQMDEYRSGHGGGRGRMEVEAESVAYTLCRTNGMSTQVGDASGAYVAGWAGSAGADAVRDAATTVSKSVRSVLDEHHWRNAA